jgi:predicted nucleic acid-binding protein
LGLILDTSILIATERRGASVEEILYDARTTYGEVDIALSAITVVELTHGIYRARTNSDRTRRRLFAEEAFHVLVVHPVSFEIAQLAGKIEGEHSSNGIVINFEDLVIGATALHFGFDIATLNLRHFQRIPGLRVVSL